MKTNISPLGILNDYFSLENEVGKRSWKTKLENEVGKRSWKTKLENEVGKRS